MRVESLEAIPYSLPFREPYVTSRGQLTERDLLMVRARAEGLEGWGETAALSLRGGAGVHELAAEVEGVCRDALLEGGFEPDRIWAALAVCRSRGASAPALAAVDIALHDLAGKAAGKPLWALLGAAAASPVVCNATLPAANPTALRELAERWAADGFRTYKLKMGLASDMAQIATVRSVLGPEVKIRIDANAAWSVAEAVDRLRAMARAHGRARRGAGRRARAARRAAVADAHPAGGRRERRRRSATPGAPSSSARAAWRRSSSRRSAASPRRSRSPRSSRSTCRARSRARSASRPPRTASRRFPDQPVAAGMAHGLATERLFSETVGRGAEARGDTLRLGDEPGLGVEVDVEALEARTA